jgi:hypothetical protein
VPAGGVELDHESVTELHAVTVAVTLTGVLGELEASVGREIPAIPKQMATILPEMLIEQNALFSHILRIEHAVPNKQASALAQL